VTLDDTNFLPDTHLVVAVADDDIAGTTRRLSDIREGGIWTGKRLRAFEHSHRPITIGPTSRPDVVLGATAGAHCISWSSASPANAQRGQASQRLRSLGRALGRRGDTRRSVSKVLGRFDRQKEHVPRAYAVQALGGRAAGAALRWKIAEPTSAAASANSMSNQGAGRTAA